MRKRVVITGLGPVAEMGIGAETFFRNLMAMKRCIQDIPPAYSRKYTFNSKFYVPFPSFRLADYGLQTPYERIMEKSARAAVLGARLALQDAGIEAREDAAVIMGVGYGSLFSSFQSHLAHVLDPAPNRYNRMIIPMQMPNAVSAWISILLGVKGPNFTLNAACASGTIAIGEAFRRVSSGETDMAITGGVECSEDPTGSIMRGFDSLGALTRAGDGWPQPFSESRSGFLYSDGAGCVLILEELEGALRRGAKIYAEIADYACLSEANHIVQIEKTGFQIKRMLRQLTQDCKIDYLNAHGTGTWDNDQVETEAIRNIFGEPPQQPWINSTKGLLGHSLGASGALEAAVTAWAVYTHEIHGNQLTSPLPGLNLPRESLNAPVAQAVTLSCGFGGHLAGLRLQKAENS